MVRPELPGDLARRVGWLRGVLLSAMFFGLLVSMPLWMSARDYPMLPVGLWVPMIVAPWDKVIFGCLLGLLLGAFWVYRFAVTLFLLGSLFLVLADQNRAQPWFYMYWVMLLLSLAPTAADLAACRFALAGVYLWGGIQKCNPTFFKQVVPWFAEPVSKWVPPPGLQAVQWLIAAAPAVEIFIALALWFRITRLPAIIAAIAVHLTVLLLLGPLGHNYNLVVWPWNLAMAALVIVLFPRAKIVKTGDMHEMFPVKAVVALFWLLPILSFFGKWPSYLSFAAYSGNLARADVFVTESLRERLPESMRSFVQPTQPPINPEIQGPFIFDHQGWALKELGVPGLPEPHAFFTLGRHLVNRFSAKPYELRLLIAPRYGPTVLYQGSQSWFLVPSGKDFKLRPNDDARLTKG